MKPDICLPHKIRDNIFQVKSADTSPSDTNHVKILYVWVTIDILDGCHKAWVDLDSFMASITYTHCQLVSLPMFRNDHKGIEHIKFT